MTSPIHMTSLYSINLICKCFCQQLWTCYSTSYNNKCAPSSRALDALEGVSNFQVYWL